MSNTLSLGSKLKQRLIHREKRPPSALTFTVPVILENILTVAITMVFATYVGKLSSSSLAAMGTVNTIISVLTSLFHLTTTGASVLVARLVGAGDQWGSSIAVEQSLGFTGLSSGLLCLLFAVFATPVIRLIIPTAEPQLFEETVLYFRMLVISFPFYLLYLICCNILRAAGSSTVPMLVSIFLNVSHIIFCAVVVTSTDLGLFGLGLAFIICRIAAAAIVAFFLFKNHSFHLSVKHIFKPDFPMLKRILNIGLPDAAANVCVQLGYMVANSMIVGLGTAEATVFQVVNQAHPFCSIPQTICSALTIPFVGQALGEKNIPKARKNTNTILLIGFIASVVLSLILMALGPIATSLFSNDSEIIRESADILWLLLVFNIFGITINTIDPALKTGGDAKFTMIVSSLAVWLIRIPLTYLFCYVWPLGVHGIFYANYVNLLVRAAAGLLRYRGSKWCAHRV